MAKLISNTAFNPISGLKNFGRDLGNTFTGQVPASHAFRRGEDRLAFNNKVKGLTGDERQKAIDAFQYTNGVSKRRIAAGVLGTYAAADIGFRTLSGGSAYRNHSGRRDLVGIPMI